MCCPLVWGLPGLCCSPGFTVGPNPVFHWYDRALSSSPNPATASFIASNIANADTPGYKAVDIDIEEAAQIVKGVSGSLPLATTATSHLSGGVQAPPFPLKYHVPYQTAADGNTVEMDTERQKFSENSLMYQFSLDRVSGHFKHFMELLQNLR